VAEPRKAATFHQARGHVCAGVNIIELTPLDLNVECFALRSLAVKIAMQVHGRVLPERQSHLDRISNMTSFRPSQLR
jgi:hypothetical protein